MKRHKHQFSEQVTEDVRITKKDNQNEEEQ